VIWGYEMSNAVFEERLTLLRMIAAEVLAIDTLEPTGNPAADLHVVNIEHLTLALEAAYDAGLLVGHRVARGRDDPEAHGEVFFP
jgi:hypothetical protein